MTESQMPGAGAGRNATNFKSGGNKTRRRCGEGIADHLIRAQITDERKSIRRIGADKMGMGGGLPVRVDTVAGAYQAIADGAERTVRFQEKCFHAAITIVCDKKNFAGGIHTHMTRADAAGTFLVQ